MIEIQRIDRAILRHGNRFFDRFFTSQELIDSQGHTPALAARFAVKEAVAKALGTGIGDVSWKEIEIVNGPRREPVLHLTGAAAEQSKRMGLAAWAISMSHTHEHAVGVAVATGAAPGPAGTPAL